jgi:Uma2 family endonuclease
MALATPVRRLTDAEYLQIERAAEVKSSFYGGEMFAMGGGTRWHSLISANLIRELGFSLKGRSSRVYDSNMRVKTESTGLYAYPDVVVSCGSPQFVDAEMDTLLNPTLVVEVLSESTEAYDRGLKAESYRQIPSLREYLLVSQTTPHVEQYIRQQNDAWFLQDVVGLESRLNLPSLNVSIPFAEIFANVEFPRTGNRTVPLHKS